MKPKEKRSRCPEQSKSAKFPAAPIFATLEGLLAHFTMKPTVGIERILGRKLEDGRGQNYAAKHLSVTLTPANYVAASLKRLTTSSRDPSRRILPLRLATFEVSVAPVTSKSPVTPDRGGITPARAGKHVSRMVVIVGSPDRSTQSGPVV
jgi:hypothetical protein